MPGIGRCDPLARGVLSRLSMPAKNQDLHVLKADITEPAQLDLPGLLRMMND